MSARLARLPEPAAKALLATHALWSRVLPIGYRVYHVPGGRIYLDLADSKMMLMRALGRYEVAKIEAVRRFLPRAGTFVDIGVNKGDFSLLAASVAGEDGRVLAFEPEPDNCRWVRKSLELNDYRNVELHELALSNEDGHATLHLGANSGFHSLATGLPRRDRGEIQVRTRRLDGLLEEIGVPGPTDVMKIDVEGAEMRVLEGARETLARNEKLVLLLDAHPNLGVDPREVGAFLGDLGFSCFRMEPPFDQALGIGRETVELVAHRVSRGRALP